MSGSFAKLATVTASTTRVGAIVGGLEPAPVAEIATLKCLPLDPLTPDIAASYGLDVGAFVEVLYTMCEGGLDILPHDQLITGGVTYAVRAVEEWNWRPDGTDFLVLILEEVV